MAEILSDVIKSRIVIDALNHVVDRTEVLNSSRYPDKDNSNWNRRISASQGEDWRCRYHSTHIRKARTSR